MTGKSVPRPSRRLTHVTVQRVVRPATTGDSGDCRAAGGLAASTGGSRGTARAESATDDDVSETAVRIDSDSARVVTGGGAALTGAGGSLASELTAAGTCGRFPPNSIRPPHTPPAARRISPTAHTLITTVRRRPARRPQNGHTGVSRSIIFPQARQATRPLSRPSCIGFWASTNPHFGHVVATLRARCPHWGHRM